MSHFQDRLALSGLGLGALFVSASAVILGLAGTTPATATLARSVFALPVLAVLAARERRRSGGMTTDRTAWSVVCGVLFCGDMLLWTQSISEVGAGLSTVLVNAQVAIVPLLAWLFDRERVPQRFLWALPVVLTGVVLAGGVLEHGIGGSDPRTLLPPVLEGVEAEVDEIRRIPVVEDAEDAAFVVELVEHEE